MVNEQQLRKQIEEVRSGARSRRAFLRHMMSLGLSAPFVTQMLLQCGIASAATDFQYKPTKAGGGGALKVLWWQGPTLLNPHFAVGTKDQDGSRRQSRAGARRRDPQRRERRARQGRALGRVEAEA
jgi:peptide/nickel transport system substrate-binding protein